MKGPVVNPEKIFCLKKRNKNKKFIQIAGLVFYQIKFERKIAKIREVNCNFALMRVDLKWNVFHMLSNCHKIFYRLGFGNHRVLVGLPLVYFLLTMY